MSSGFIIVCGDCGTELPDLEAIEIVCPGCATAAGKITMRFTQNLRPFSADPPSGGITYAADLPDTVSAQAISAAVAPKPGWDMEFLP
jgi:hypothetical protein